MIPSPKRIYLDIVAKRPEDYIKSDEDKLFIVNVHSLRFWLGIHQLVVIKIVAASKNKFHSPRRSLCFFRFFLPLMLEDDWYILAPGSTVGSRCKGRWTEFARQFRISIYPPKC